MALPIGSAMPVFDGATEWLNQSIETATLRNSPALIVREAAAEMGLTGPCAIDNAHAIGDHFQTGGVWPCYFLFDAEGRLRSRAAGALGLKMAENSLKRLFAVGEPDRELAGAAS